MVYIEKLVFNPFQENTYFVFDETGKCVIIDPGCYEKGEEDYIIQFINTNNLKPDRLIHTHCHVDHILGNNFIAKTFGLKPEIHEAGLPFLKDAHLHAQIYGFNIDPVIEPESFLVEDDIIEVGAVKLKVLYTPGHADGSICLVNDEQHFVVVGDVLFKDSIGRTDFPTGDFDVLKQSIHNKLFTLEDDFTVYCGHGPETSIGNEKLNNSFVRF